jgi:hypothetical protein
LNAVGNINTNGTVTNIYQLPVPGSEPSAITAGPDGALWFTEFLANKIGRITTSGAITEFPLPFNPELLTNVAAFGIILGPDNNLWFSEYNDIVGTIGRITPAGVLTVFPTITAASFPTFLATDATNVWFGEFSSGGFSAVDDRIGEIIPAQALSLSAGNSSTATETFSGNVATFYNSDPTNTVTVGWGDGTTNVLMITNAATYLTNTVVVTNSATVTNSLTISNTAAIGTNGSDGTFTISGVHNYAANTNFAVTITVTDSSNDVAAATVSLQTGLVPPPMLTARMASSNVVLSWHATNFLLLSATNHGGPWTNVPSAASPYTNPITGPQQFFKLKSK